MTAVIGLTGGIGSGKSTVARLFGELGIHWVDADDVARQVVEPGTPALEQIRQHFGDRILDPQGGLDRAALRAIVFRDPDQRTWLEGLLHPLIRQELQRQLVPEHYDQAYSILVSPLLLETDQHTMVQNIVVIDVPVETQIARTMARDNNDRSQVERIIAAQMPREEKLKKADEVIDNDVSLNDVKRQVEAIHKTLLVAFG